MRKLNNMHSKRKLMHRKKDRLDWWRKDRFGMFIHWGLYAVPAGKWKGKDIPGIGEWVMSRARIPVSEYSQLTGKFNPVKFNAGEWVKVAKDAGMKYLVITAKHHDGFAMYNSPSSKYDIVDATPFGRDPIKELSKACKKAGIKLCFYYSQDQDWQDPDGSGNNWDYDEEKKDLAKYLRHKVKPQLKELLTQYGPVGLIWFDTPYTITESQSRDLKRFVHRLQPDCLVSGRVGHGVGDYGSMGDNQIPLGRVKGNWETPATINDTWGFKANDHNWKSVKTLLYLLVDLASKGVNYLLNVGPTAEGSIPRASVRRLEEIGKWMKVNGEAIYDTIASPYPYEFEWGRITSKKGKLYLLLTGWPRGKFILRGLRNKVKKAYMLADNNRKVEVVQVYRKPCDQHVLELCLPRKKPDKLVSVVVLNIAGEADVDQSPLQQTNGTISLPAHMAELHMAKTGSRINIDCGGVIQNWKNKKNWISWNFKVSQPGAFEVDILSPGPRDGKWKGGHKVKIMVAGKNLSRLLKSGRKSSSPRCQYFPETVLGCGKVTIAKSGTYELKLKAEAIDKNADRFAVSEVKLVYVK